MKSLLLIILFPVMSWAHLSPHDFEKDTSLYKVLVFVSDVCPCSQSHVEHLNSLAKAYPQVKMYAVISEKVTTDHRKESDAYFSKDRFQFPVIEDSEQKLVKSYSALKTPHASLLIKNPDTGEYKVAYQGGVTNGSEFKDSSLKYLEENLKAISQNLPMKHSRGVSLGCYIKR